MASISVTFFIIFSAFSLFIPLTLSSTLLEDLNNLHPPPDFNTTLTNNCLHNPSLRYCNKNTPFNLPEIFKSTIVASHLCNESKNPNCVESFPNLDLRSRPNLASLYLSFTFFWKYCPLSISRIDLANNSFKGSFPNDVFCCSQIKALDLSYNKLSGDVPIQKFSLLTNLTLLNLSYNHFSESKISDSQFFKRFNASSFLHSGLIPDRKKFRIKAFLLLFGFPILVIFMVISFCWLCFWRPDVLPKMLQNKHKFTPSVLKAATNGFSSENVVNIKQKLGIYKGVMRNGTEVRIEVYWGKLLRKKRRKFVDEGKVLVELSHTNIIRVLGWCDSRKLRGIVKEWVDGESVEMWLRRSVPPWKQRVKVLMGVVEGVCYLLEEWPQVGYDLKTRSVLLGEDGEPLISRFKVEDDQNIWPKNTYKLGLFVLEVIINRRPHEEFEDGEAGFVEWVRMNYPHDLENVIDERMKRNGHIVDQAAEGIELGLRCTDMSNDGQPNSDQIFKIVSTIYSSCMASASPKRTRVHGHRVEGHGHMQSS